MPSRCPSSRTPPAESEQPCSGPRKLFEGHGQTDSEVCTKRKRPGTAAVTLGKNGAGRLTGPPRPPGDPHSCCVGPAEGQAGGPGDGTRSPESTRVNRVMVVGTVRHRPMMNHGPMNEQSGTSKRVRGGPGGELRGLEGAGAFSGATHQT